MATKNGGYELKHLLQEVGVNATINMVVAFMGTYCHN
jgi:hypothetical protein